MRKRSPQQVTGTLPARNRQVARGPSATALSNASAADRLAWGLRHDLATPLTSIVLATELLGSAAPMAAERRVIALETIRRSALWMGMILEDNFERRAALTGGTSPTYVNDCITVVSTMLQPVLENKEQTLRINGDPNLKTTVPRSVVQRAVMNLVVNASKYGPVNDEIEISSGIREGEVYISVLDHGSGVEPDEASSVFEWGERGRNAISGDEQGFGIGLAMVRDLLSTVGGTVTIWSGSEGCEARVTLPLYSGRSVTPMEGEVA